MIPMVLEPISVGIGLSVLACVIACYFFINSRRDEFEQVFDADARKILNQNEKPKTKAAKSSKNTPKAKRDFRDIDIDKLFQRLSGIEELEPEYLFFLAGHINFLVGQMEQLQEQMTAVQGSKAALDVRFKTQTNARVVAEGKLAELKQEMSEMSGKLKKTIASELELTERVAMTQKKHNEMAALLARGVDERSKLQAQVNKLTDDIHEANDRVAQYAADDKEREDILIELQAKIKDMCESLIDFEITKSEVAAAKMNYLDSVAVIKELEAKLLKTEQDLYELRTTETDQNTTNTEQMDLINTLKEEKRQWIIEEEEVRKECETTKGLLERLNSEVEKFEAYKAEIGTKMEEVAANKALIRRQQKIMDEQAQEIEHLCMEKSLLEEDQVKLHHARDDSKEKRLLEKDEEIRVRSTKMAQIENQMKILFNHVAEEESLDVMSDMPKFDLDKFPMWLESVVKGIEARSVAGREAFVDDCKAPEAAPLEPADDIPGEAEEIFVPTETPVPEHAEEIQLEADD